MPDIEDCRQSLRTWIKKIFTDKQVLFSGLNADQPNESYFSIKLIRTKWYPHPVETIISDEEETVAGYAKLFFSIQYIGGTDPRTILQRLTSSFDSIGAELFFYSAEMGICGPTGEIIDVPVIDGQEWEERAAMTMTFDVIVTDIFAPEFATSAEITINGDEVVTISREE